MGANFILCIYPILLIVLLLFGAKAAPKGMFYEDFFSLKTAKVLQGVAAIGIILHHLVQEVTNYGAIWKGPITHMNWMGILFTSVFFFSSGYGLLKSYETKPDYLEGFLEKRLPAVIIPFLMSNVIYLIALGVYGGRIHRVTDTVTSLVGFTLLNTNTWFLVEIIIFYLAFYALYKHLNNKNHAFISMVGFVVFVMGISLLLGHDNSEINGHWFMGEWWYNSTIVFAVGMLVARYEKNFLEFIKKNYKWIFPVILLGFVGIFILSEYMVQNVGYYCEWEGHRGYSEKVLTALAQSTTGILFMLMIILVCMKVRFYNKIIAFLGKISLALYIIHDLIKQTVLNKYEDMADTFFFLLVLVFSLVAACILHLVNENLIKLWRWWREKAKQVPETLEAKLKWKKRKENKKKIIVWAVLIGIVLAGFMGKEAYDKYMIPELNYREELEMLPEAQIGDTVYFGMFYLGSVAKKERIPWIVADKKEGQILLVAADGLYGNYYQQEYKASSWEDSSIRSLLNDEFLYMGFSKKERKLIVNSEIMTEKNSQYGTEGGNITYDKIFLLSAEEAGKYFNDAESSKITPTAYAFRFGINYNSNKEGSWWWLRTMGKENNMAAVVSQDGEINLEGELVSVASGAVRPAIWVKVD